MTTVTITRSRRRGRYVPGDDGRPGRACVRAGWSARHGEIRTGNRTWTVRRLGWRRVTLGDGGALLARLGRDDVVVPGKGPGGGRVISRGWRTYRGRSRTAPRR